MATHWTLGCDAADPHRIAAFWARALGYVPEPGYDDPDGASIVDPDGRGPAIGFLRVPEGKTAKNRMHIDIRVAGERPWDPAERERLVRERVAELVCRGATVREDSYDGVPRARRHARPRGQRVLRRLTTACVPPSADLHTTSTCPPPLPPGVASSVRARRHRPSPARTGAGPPAIRRCRRPMRGRP